MSRIDTFLLSILSHFGVDPAAGDLAGEVGSTTQAPSTRPKPATPARISPYRPAPVAWGVAVLPTPAARRAATDAEQTAVDRRRPQRSRRTRRSQVEASSLPRPRGLLT